MTVIPANIGWSAYGGYEGPMFIGHQPYVLPVNPSENDVLMAVVTAAEGGHYDAINMYDAGIVSVGLIQWIDAGQHSVDSMLGQVATDAGIDKVTGPLADALAQAGATFKKNPQGAWRFFNAAGEVVTNAQERVLFMKGCGPKGAWTDDARQYAKVWASCLANVWADPAARKAQIDYTAPKVKSFLLSDVKTALYDSQPSAGWPGAVRAAMVSFAVNLPAEAAREFRAYSSTAQKWSPDWCIGLLKKVTFGGGIGIWPARYSAIRPVLEAQFGVALPKTSKDLQAWNPTGADVAVLPHAPPPPVVVIPPVVVAPTPVVVSPVVPEPTAPAPSEPISPLPNIIVPDATPGWRVLLNFIMMLINLFTKRGN